MKALIALPLLLAVSAAPHRATFPGLFGRVRSPSSSAEVFYCQHGEEPGDYKLKFMDSSGRIFFLEYFQRSVDVVWSPAGTRFFVTDYVGSNITDCIVARPQRGRVRGVTLTGIISRTAGHPTGAESPERAHYYVHCDRWLSDRLVEGEIDGHTDEARMYDFHYPFLYDAATRRLAWLSKEPQPPPPWPPLRKFVSRPAKELCR